MVVAFTQYPSKYFVPVLPISISHRIWYAFICVHEWTCLYSYKYSVGIRVLYALRKKIWKQIWHGQYLYSYKYSIGILSYMHSERKYDNKYGMGNIHPYPISLPSSPS